MMFSIKKFLNKIFRVADDMGNRLPAVRRPQSDEAFFADVHVDPWHGGNYENLGDPTSKMDPNKRAKNVPTIDQIKTFVLGKWTRIREDNPNMQPQIIVRSIENAFRSDILTHYDPADHVKIMRDFKTALVKAGNEIYHPKMLNPPPLTREDKNSLVDKCIMTQIHNTIAKVPDIHASINKSPSEMALSEQYKEFEIIGRDKTLMDMYQKKMEKIRVIWEKSPEEIALMFELPRVYSLQEFDDIAHRLEESEHSGQDIKELEKEETPVSGVSSEDIATEFEKAYLWNTNDPNYKIRQKEMHMNDPEIDMHSILVNRVFRSVPGGWLNRKGDERLRFFIDTINNAKFPEDAQIIKSKLASLGIDLSTIQNNPAKYQSMGSNEIVNQLTSFLVNDFIKPAKESLYQWVKLRFNSARVSEMYGDGNRSLDETNDQGDTIHQVSEQNRAVQHQSPVISTEERQELLTERDQGIKRYSKLIGGINDVGESIVQHMIGVIKNEHRETRKAKTIEVALYVDAVRDYLVKSVSDVLSKGSIVNIFNNPARVKELMESGLEFYLNDGRRKIRLLPGDKRVTDNSQAGDIEVAPGEGKTWGDIDYSKVLGYRKQAEMVQKFIDERIAKINEKNPERFTGELEGLQKLRTRSTPEGIQRKDQDVGQSLYTIAQFAMQYLGDWIIDKSTGKLRFPRQYVQAMFSTLKIRPQVVALGTLMSQRTPNEQKIPFVRKYIKSKISRKATESIPSIDALKQQLGKDIISPEDISKLTDENLIPLIPLVAKEYADDVNITGHENYRTFMEAPEYEGGQIAAAYEKYINKILKLADMKDSLSKFASTDNVNNLMAQARFDLEAELLNIGKKYEDYMRLQ